MGSRRQGLLRGRGRTPGTTISRGEVSLMNTPSDLTVTRKTILRSLAALPGLVSLTSGLAEANGARGDSISLRYLGTAGWEIGGGTTTILVDPYLSRINGPPPPGVPRDPKDARPAVAWDGIANCDVATVDAHVGGADLILVTHTHYDHVLDVPHIALKTGAAVIGTESTMNVLRAYDVPERQLLTVRGGEDYEFASFSVKVIPSIHSALDHKHYFSSAVAPAGLRAPLTLQQIHPEGGTLAFLVRLGGHQILAFGSMNYVEREIDGLRPDVVIAGAGASRGEIHDYSRRLMGCLGSPGLVLPTHWDNFLEPFGASQQRSIDAVQSFVSEIRSSSPKSKVVVPEYFSAVAWP